MDRVHRQSRNPGSGGQTVRERPIVDNIPGTLLVTIQDNPTNTFF